MRSEIARRTRFVSLEAWSGTLLKEGRVEPILELDVVLPAIPIVDSVRVELRWLPGTGEETVGVLTRIARW